eukprot:TRINITY_DN27882_c0_g1_i2.p1 TRINITY_DN27882_c0_g1~~TRINITY_DN27882_c0_g1_i2.p1  ORF type:complete len:775 (-),score=190.77 TRINITY_DN27882_c0_g1_i2:734-3058(-)
MQARMSGELFVRRNEPLQGGLSGPTLLTLLELRGASDRQSRPGQGLRSIVAELRVECPELACSPCAAEEPWRWAETQEALDDLSAEELVALKLAAVGSDADFLSSMNRFLHSYNPGAVSEKGDAAKLWEVYVTYLMDAFRKLRRDDLQPERVVRVAWVLQESWDEFFKDKQGSELCFCGVQPCASEESWSFLAPPAQGRVPVVFEFDSTMARGAVSTSRVASQAGEMLLPPFQQAVVESIHLEHCPEVEMDVYRVRLRGLRCLEPLPEVLNASPESILAGALLIGLHSETAAKPEETAPGTLRSWLTTCFEALGAAVQVKPDEPGRTVWKSYWACLRENCHTWPEIKKSIRTGVMDIAGLAVHDAAFAAKGVASRFLGFSSCIDYEAMEIEQEVNAEERQKRNRHAVEAVSEHVNALELETLTDLESFLRFLEHDPGKAFQLASAAAQAYIAAEAPQRVLLFAKLTGLAGVAGGLMRGDSRVLGAYDSPYPLSVDPWEAMCAADTTSVTSIPEGQEAAAMHALCFLQLMRLHLARTRLLLVAGATDVGKTTVMREAFGFQHLSAGLGRQGRTEQITFELHPDADEQHAPVYIVDTPGFGDGEAVHRNDMGRILKGAGGWIPGGVSLLWVVKAGRHVRQESDSFLRNMMESGVMPIIVVTHMDKLFEERYREAGPQWRDGILQGVSPKDERWREQRRVLMSELSEEVASGIKCALGTENLPQLAYACLAGWMTTDGDDEFAQPPPWPWARQELMSFFDVKDSAGLRRWLDGKLGL